MQIRFLGHAAFSIEVNGLRLCVDPHRPGALGGRFHLPAIVGPFDAVLTSHRHEDHAGWTPALGTNRWIDRATDLRGPGGQVVVRTRPAFHDSVGGTRMGLVRMLSIAAAGRRVVHCGDIGAFDDDDVAWLAGADALLVPVGGTFTLDGAGAADLVRRVAPRCVVPMHARDPDVDLALDSIEPFVQALAAPVRRRDALDLPRDCRAGGPIVYLLNRPSSPPGAAAAVEAAAVPGPSGAVAKSSQPGSTGVQGQTPDSDPRPR